MIDLYGTLVNKQTISSAIPFKMCYFDKCAAADESKKSIQPVSMFSDNWVLSWINGFFLNGSFHWVTYEHPERIVALDLAKETYAKLLFPEYYSISQDDYRDFRLTTPNVEAAKGKEKMEHFGIELEDTSYESDNLSPIHPSIKGRQTMSKDNQGVIKGPIKLESEVKEDSNSSSSEDFTIVA
ncbi:hypothetical protein Tco_0470791 [Tanacetum coccineum]